MVTNGSNGNLAAIQRSWPRASAAFVHRFGPWLAQAGLPFLLIAYLGLRGGGYDAIVRSEIGIAVWWVVLLGAVVGALPRTRLSPAAWATLGLMAAFASWTALGIGWSESSERSVAELGRVATLLGVFALALAVQGRESLRRMVSGAAGGIALVAGVALLSRLQPTWFPELEAPRLIPETQARLHYPLNYWNGLAAFTAIGMPLLLALATAARHVATRALALAAVPALALTAFFTLSRGGAVEVAVALVALFALHPRRLALAAHAALAATGSVILIAAANQRDALSDGLTSATAQNQGDEMLAMSLVVCAGVALLAAALALAERHGVGPRPASVSRRTAALAATGGAVVAVVVALGAGAPAQLTDSWEEFKDPAVPTAASERFESASGSGRYQWWQSAVDANATEPLLGIGPGTFEYWWAREGTIPGFVRDAHSLYLETLAELGIIGLVLVLLLVASPFVFGVRRLFALDAERRILLAGALAGCAAFAVAAAIDWVWELTVLPVVFLLLAAAAIGRPSNDSEEVGRSVGSLAARAALCALALAGTVAIAVPMAGDSAVRESQAQVRTQDLTGALGEARAAADIEPFAATPHLQQALVLELRGELGAAISAAREATDAEPTNWRTWLVLSRLEAQAGNARASVAAYREARLLNPRSPLFQ